MKKYLNVFLALCFTTLALTASAQFTCNSRTFGIRDGLPATNISGMDQDSRGLLWIATWNGLCCYDGYRFITFPGNNWGDNDALSTNRIAMLRVDTKDNLWLRTYDGGLYLFDTRQCRYFNISRAVERQYGEQMKPRNIYCLPTGHTWITDESGAMTLRINDDHPTDISRIEVFGSKGHHYEGSYIRKVQANRQGREWITTDQGMLRYDGGGRFSKQRPVGLDSWLDEGVDTALTWRLKVSGIQQRDIQKYHIDRQGNLWYSSAHGLTLVTFRQQRMQLLSVGTDEQTRSVLCRRNGTVLAGTQDGYIKVMGDGGWLAPNGTISSSRVKFSDRIYALFEDSQGRTWVGTKGDGLYIIGTDGRVTHCLPDSSNRYSLSHNFVYDFDEDARGNIWIATYGGGINIYNSARFLHSGNDLKGYPLAGFPRTRRITHTADGTMLISSTTGLLTCNSALAASPASLTFYTTRHDRNDTSSLRTNDVMQALVTRSGAIYVATQGGGIQQVTSQQLLSNNLQLKSIDELNHSVGNVQSMTEDKKGQIWIARETGIDRYVPQTRQLQQEHIEVGAEDDHQTVILTESLPSLATDGCLWLGTIGGVLTFNVNNMAESDYKPCIVFTSVQYQGEQETSPLLYRDTLVVSPDKRNLTISFTALDYTDNSLVQYAWRMDGDAQWNYIRTPHIAFSNLSPGHHRLEVRSTNGDGVWTDNADVLELVVTPLWWERHWVQLLIALALILLSAWGIVRWQHHRQQTREREQRLESILRQYRELQEQEQQRQQYSHSVDGRDLISGKAFSSEGEAPAPVVREYKLSEPQIANEDELLMDRLMAFIEQHISDDALRIDDMAEAVNMGRTAFYEKIKQIVGLSPSDFLRQVRMQRARQLISKSTMNFSQIAYSVGFTDPKYFTKCFKKETGMTPSEYREKEA